MKKSFSTLNIAMACLMSVSAVSLFAMNPNTPTNPPAVEGSSLVNPTPDQAKQPEKKVEEEKKEVVTPKKSWAITTKIKNIGGYLWSNKFNTVAAIGTVAGLTASAILKSKKVAIYTVIAASVYSVARLVASSLNIGYETQKDIKSSSNLELEEKSTKVKFLRNGWNNLKSVPSTINGTLNNAPVINWLYCPKKTISAFFEYLSSFKKPISESIVDSQDDLTSKPDKYTQNSNQ